MNALVVLNEQHSLLPQQKEILDKNFSYWEIYRISKNGMTVQEQKNLVDMFCRRLPKDTAIVFASPIPLVIAKLAYMVGRDDQFYKDNEVGVTKETRLFIFTNDKREKKEFPDGRIVLTDGWTLEGVGADE